MATCESPRCSAVGRWSVTATGRRVCAEHIPDGQAVTLAEPVTDEAIHDQPHPPVSPAMSASPADDGILAAVCPPGWRRSPLDGRPVMPLVGRMLFPGDEDTLPTLGDMQRQMGELYDYTESMKPCWVSLIQAVIGDAMANRRHGREGLSQATEVALSNCIDAVLRFRGEVRIRRTAAGGWEEVGSDEATA